MKIRRAVSACTEHLKHIYRDKVMWVVISYNITKTVYITYIP